jgi:hypothetical protein
MKSAIMQPTFNPWLGYFDLIDQVDTFVFLDDTQLTKRSWQVRNKIKLNGSEFWLTLPVKKTASRDELLLCDAALNNDEKWKKKHISTLENAYRKTVHFKVIIEFLKPLYKAAENLSNFNTSLIVSISEKIGLKTEFVFSSKLEGVKGKKDFKLNSILELVDSEVYISPQGSAIYLNELSTGGEIVRNRRTLFYHDYHPKEYLQTKGDFIPYLGIFDVLFNEGFDRTLEIIRAGRKDLLNFDVL